VRGIGTGTVTSSAPATVALGPAAYGIRARNAAPISVSCSGESRPTQGSQWYTVDRSTTLAVAATIARTKAPRNGSWVLGYHGVTTATSRAITPTLRESRP
jgi:hypothetical protein